MSTCSWVLHTLNRLHVHCVKMHNACRELLPIIPNISHLGRSCTISLESSYMREDFWSCSWCILAGTFFNSVFHVILDMVIRMLISWNPGQRTDTVQSNGRRFFQSNRSPIGSTWQPTNALPGNKGLLCKKHPKNKEGIYEPSIVFQWLAFQDQYSTWEQFHPPISCRQNQFRTSQDSQVQRTFEMYVILISKHNTGRVGDILLFLKLAQRLWWTVEEPILILFLAKLQER